MTVSRKEEEISSLTEELSDSQVKFSKKISELTKAQESNTNNMNARETMKRMVAAEKAHDDKISQMDSQNARVAALEKEIAALKVELAVERKAAEAYRRREKYDAAC